MEVPLSSLPISSRSVQKHGRYRQFLFLIGGFLKNKKFYSETALPNQSKCVGKHPWTVLYQKCSLSSDPFTNMAATGNSCFRAFHRSFLPGFGSFDQKVSEEKIFSRLAIQNQELPVQDCPFRPNPFKNMTATGNSCF
jgi:hypothetical protein